MASCACGTTIAHAFQSLGCLECGQPCCPACAISLESATYCRGCAASLLESLEVRAQTPFEVH